MLEVLQHLTHADLQANQSLLVSNSLHVALAVCEGIIVFLTPGSMLLTYITQGAM